VGLQFLKVFSGFRVPVTLPSKYFGSIGAHFQLSKLPDFRSFYFIKIYA
jgi:hypothetical protein